MLTVVFLLSTLGSRGGPPPACPLTKRDFKDVWAFRTAAAQLPAAPLRAACARRGAALFPTEYVAHFDAGGALAVAAAAAAAPKQQRGDGDRARAADAYERAIQLNPVFTHAMNNLGGLYKEMGRYSEAISLLNRGIDVDPTFAGLYYNLGMVHAKQQDAARALPQLQQAIARWVTGQDFRPFLSFLRPF
jgi:tetratricopeptide (TPR) repeat protein|eukprot:COSAG01_NODE_1797_length_9211_cov_28.889816_14_plen_190_part_00